jgi:hypothetical protein
MTQNPENVIAIEDVGAPTSAPTREDVSASSPRLGAPAFLDKHGNEVDRRYEDFFRPLTAYQLAVAFPECRDLATRRRLQLMRAIGEYRDRIAEIAADASMSDDDKHLAIVCQKVFMRLDPRVQEINLLDSYLKMIPRESEVDPVTHDPIVRERELLNIEKAKSFPLHELFDPQHLRETSSTITCCCPFHNERTPSFTIYKRSNRYKCFSCGESGDSIHFYIKTHNCDFKTAVRMLT